MLRVITIVALVVLLVSATGCVSVMMPAQGSVYADVAWSQDITANAGATKSASATATSFFGIVALGDVTVSTLAAKAGITKIHHIDTHTKNIIGYGVLTVTVYGE
jgi:hypothetical protein